MKKRLRKTGEIVDVIDFCCIELIKERDDKDWVSYIDSKGVEHHVEQGLNIYWDFEDVGEELTKEIDWEQVRIDATIAAMQSFIREIYIHDDTPRKKTIASLSVSHADALIAGLKKGGKDSQVLYHFVKMADVRHKTHMYLTSVDPPEVIRFVKTQYHDVELIKPRMSIYEMAKKKHILPTMRIRWCCAEYGRKVYGAPSEEKSVRKLKASAMKRLSTSGASMRKRW